MYIVIPVTIFKTFQLDSSSFILFSLMSKENCFEEVLGWGNSKYFPEKTVKNAIAVTLTLNTKDRKKEDSP